MVLVFNETGVGLSPRFKFIGMLTKHVVAIGNRRNRNIASIRQLLPFKI